MAEADVEDCVQEVWKTVTEKLPDFRRPADRPGLRAWLYSVVRSKAIDLVRRRQRRADQELETLPHEPASREADPADLVERRWERMTLEMLVEQLQSRVSRRNARLLELRLLQRRSTSEVATLLGLTTEQVRYRQHRLLQRLRTLLAVYIGKSFGRRG